MSGGEVAAAEFSKTEMMSDKEQKEAIAGFKPRERTNMALAASKKLIARVAEQHLFTNPAAQEAAKNAETYESGEVNTDSSKGLKGIIDALDAVPADGEDHDLAVGYLGYVTEFVQVRTSDGLIPLPEWRAKLASATPEERAVLEKQGLYGFVFPKEKGEVPSGDELFDSYKTQVQDEIKRRKDAGEDTAAYEAFLGRLTTASQANGEIGVLLKANTLRELHNSGLVSDEDKPAMADTISSMSEQEKAAQEKLVNLLRTNGMSDAEIVEARQTIAEQGLLVFLGRTDLDTKLKDLDKLMFDKNIDRDELVKMLMPYLDQKNRTLVEGLIDNKGTIGIGLLFLLLAPIAAGVLATGEIAKSATR